MEAYQRTAVLLGDHNLQLLRQSHVAVFGVGGVGGHCIEAIARSGIGKISIFDYDSISISNLNRQIIALHSTIGKKKVKVMKERLLDIDPKITVYEHDLFIDSSNIEMIDFSSFDYIIDAIDTVTSKLLLIEKAKEYNIPIISCMGTGNKLYPDKLKVMMLSQTSYCPLARVMRRELKKRGISKLKVLASSEKPLKPLKAVENNKHIPGSTAFVPSSAGLMIASEVVLDIIKLNNF